MYAIQTELNGWRIPAAGVEHVLVCGDKMGGDEYSFGTGLTLAWAARPTPAELGLLVIEHDVLVDPDDIEAISLEVETDPRAVIAAPYVCWPKSTALPRPMTLPRFNHGVHVFGLGCTWLPAVLLDAMFTELPKISWRNLDVAFSERAMALGLTVRMPFGTAVKHAHF